MSLPEPEPKAEPEGEPEAEPVGEPKGEYESEPMSELITEPVPEAEFSSNEEKYLWIALYAICMLLIVIGDALIIIAILKSKEMRQRTSNMYLLSLIFARTLIGVFVVPNQITASFSEEYMGSVACKLCHFSALGSSATSIISVVAVAVDKYQELMKFQVTGQKMERGKEKVSDKVQSHQAKKKLKKTFLIISGMWVLGHIYGIRNAFVNDMIVRNGRLQCINVPTLAHLNKWFLIADFLLLFTAPLFVILYCYISVIHFSLTRSPEAANSINQKALRTSQMLVVVMILFIVCNIPPYTLRMMSTWSSQPSAVDDSLEKGLYLASYSNSWLNVLVYLIFREDLRNGIRALCKCYKP